MLAHACRCLGYGASRKPQAVAERAMLNAEPLVTRGRAWQCAWQPRWPLTAGLTLSLSVMAGILAPLVCTAALRFARCYNVAINPPGWSSSLRASTLGAASLHVALVAPVLCLAMFLQLLGIGDLLSDTAMFWARWGAICACGFIMLLGECSIMLPGRSEPPFRNVTAGSLLDSSFFGQCPWSWTVAASLTFAGSRTAIQSYLNTAMVAWFVAKNKALKPEDTSGTVAKEIRNINTVINYFIHRCDPPFHSE